jgi:hypothetical protein
MLVRVNAAAVLTSPLGGEVAPRGAGEGVFMAFVSAGEGASR